MIRFFRWLFKKQDYQYHPVSNWIVQGNDGWHNNNWSNR